MISGSATWTEAEWWTELILCGQSHRRLRVNVAEWLLLNLCQDDAARTSRLAILRTSRVESLPRICSQVGRITDLESNVTQRYDPLRVSVVFGQLKVCLLVVSDVFVINLGPAFISSSSAATCQTGSPATSVDCVASLAPSPLVSFTGSSGFPHQSTVYFV